jgi:cytochrome c
MSGGFLGLGLLVAALLGAGRTSEGAPGVGPAPPASAHVGNAAAGKETFTQYCSICHGAGAKGFIGPSIAGIDWTAPGLQSIVRSGLGGYGGMPAFSADAVTDDNIADVAAYLASLAPAARSKSANAPQTAADGVAVAAAPTPTSAASASLASSAPLASPASQAAPPGAGDPAHGRHVYGANCAACHGAKGQGGFGPSLIAEKNRKNTAAAIAWIENPKPPMPKLYPSTISEKDVEDVAAYIESL